MSGLPEPTESVSHRTALPRIPGWPSGLLPWWGATLVAVTATLIGFAYHAGAGNQELGAVFATFYVLGCLAAVVLVRRSGIFTAVIQPPLILFVAVPASYFLMHSGQINGLKDIVINCGYPLIERFPLMFFTSAAVLLFGVARWYLDKQSADSAESGTTAADLAEKVSRRLRRSTEPDAEDEPRAARKPRRPRESGAREARAPREPRRTRAGEPSRARHNRPPDSDIAASAAAADRRERAAARERYRPRRDDEPPMPGERRQPRRRDPRDLREPRRRTPPPPRGYDGPDYDRDRRDHDRPRRRPTRDSYDSGYADSYADYEPRYRARPDERRPEPPRRSREPDDSHLPYTRVRYRRED
ncbi:DUF6542 domain-containing protein [Mycobacterium sp. NPDC003323]